jgi:hypothetical protein
MAATDPQRDEVLADMQARYDHLAGAPLVVR